MARLPSPELGRLAAEVKEQTSLAEVIGRSVSWDRRRSNPSRGWWACCPFHHERTASFHVDDAKGFYYCFGCQAKGDLFTWAAEMQSLDFVSALKAYAAEAGVPLPPQLGGQARPAPALQAAAERRAARAAEERRQRDLAARADAERGLRRAAEIWREATPDSPLLSRYLKARGVDTKALRRAYGGPCPALRLHPALPYYVWTGARWEEAWRGPAMIGRVTLPGDHAIGIHRTWITPEGRKTLDGVKLNKRWLGYTGRMHGAAVRFTAHTRAMIVGEGIETVLAVWSRLARAYQDGRGPHWSAEAALSKGALCGAQAPVGGTAREGLRPLPSALPDWTAESWRAPDYVDRLVILAEGSAADPAGAERDFTRARRRHQLRGDGTVRTCELRLPGGRWDRGLDFADLAEGAA